jgi:hypothetical protein
MKKLRISALAQYTKSRIGYGSKKNTSVYDLVCEALEMDGMPLPMDITAKSWVMSNLDYVYIEAKKVSGAFKKLRIPHALELPDTKQVEAKRKQDVSSNSFLNTYAWRKLRMEALKKYGPKCMCCGATPATGAVMNVDHIKPRKLFPSLALNIDNLQILCHECNHGKGNWDRTDWRSL